MKKIIAFISIFFILTLGLIKYTEASVRVRGYFRSNGTYVQPHYRSNPDIYKWNNWSVKGNINPYTGKSGTLNPWRW
jgi:hypothetical protein